MIMKKFTYKKLLKAISFLVLSIAFAVNAYSQNWCPAGATWYYTDESATMSGYSKLTYSHDTIINSIGCKIITHYAEGDGIFGHYAGFRFSSPYFTYEQNGVAYLYNNKEGNNKFDTLFNINAQIGDKWRFPLVDTICADSTYFMKVLNTGTKTLNGFNLKWLYIKTGPIPYPGSGDFLYGFDTITERFGPRYDDICYGLICNNSADECAHGGLRCYSDDAFGVYSTGLTSSCDYLTGTTETQIRQEILKIYPTLAQSQITLEFDLTVPISASIEIRNILGQSVKIIDNITFSNSKNKIEIDVSEFSKGLYFLEVQNENKFMSKKFVRQ